MKFSVGTAYLQYLWLQLTRKPFAIDTVDDAFDALYSFQSLTSLRLLRRMSVGVVIACLVWYVKESLKGFDKTQITDIRSKGTSSASINPTRNLVCHYSSIPIEYLGKRPLPSTGP